MSFGGEKKIMLFDSGNLAVVAVVVEVVVVVVVAWRRSGIHG